MVATVARVAGIAEQQARMDGNGGPGILNKLARTVRADIEVAGIGAIVDSDLAAQEMRKTADAELLRHAQVYSGELDRVEQIDTGRAERTMHAERLTGRHESCAVDDGGVATRRKCRIPIQRIGQIAGIRMVAVR